MGRRERCRIDSRHPNSGLVDLEQIGYQRVEVDIGVRKVIKGQFLPIPTTVRLATLFLTDKGDKTHI